MVGKFNGVLVGYRKYDKAVKNDKGETIGSEPKHVYDVFCKGMKVDKATGLCADECKVVSVIEDEQVLEKMQYGMAVEFFGETIEFRGKDGTNTRMQYSCISGVTK